MRSLRPLLLPGLLLAVLVAACGSDSVTQPTATETTSRAPRDASIMQQTQSQSPSTSLSPPQQQELSQSAQTAPPAQQTQQASGAAQSLPAEIINEPKIGEHKSVRSAGTSLGEPDAPILIEHFGDFT